MYNMPSLYYGLLVVLATFTPGLTDLNTNVTGKLPSPSQIAEGGILPKVYEDKTHFGREHVIEKPDLGREHVIENQTMSTAKISNNTQSNQTVTVTSNKLLSTLISTTEKSIEIEVPKKNDEKLSIGRKGVNFTESDLLPKETTNTSTITTSSAVVIKLKTTTKAPVPKKPNVTVHDDYVPNETKTKTDLTPKISNIDTVLEKKSKSSDYVIPIVAVILSVPLVAIIISVVYKRGTDWWQHRNYRRMDFLIEGMYNN